MSDGGDCRRHLRSEDPGIGQEQAEQEAPDEVRREHDTPQPGHHPEPAPFPPGDHRQHRCQGVLGEQLLPRQNDDEKADGIADAGDDGGTGQVPQRRGQHGLGQHGKANGKAGGEPRPPQRAEGPRQLPFALGADDLVDHGGTQTPALGDGFLLLAREPLLRGRDVVLFLCLGGHQGFPQVPVET